MKNILLTIFFSLFIFGCTRTYNCGNVNLQTAFINFEKNDLDTIIFRKYPTGNNFMDLIDSTVLVYDSTTFHQSNDTFYVQSYPLDGIKYGNDWQIYIPAKNKIISISDINSKQIKGKCGTLGEPLGCHCSNSVNSIKVNNQTVDLSNVNPNLIAYILYIQN
jgi:hypothetical protein